MSWGRGWTSARSLRQSVRRLASDKGADLSDDRGALALLIAIVGALRAALRPRASLVAENLALPQQIAVLRRKTKRSQFLPIDRAFWVTLSRGWLRRAETLTPVGGCIVVRYRGAHFPTPPNNAAFQLDYEFDLK